MFRLLRYILIGLLIIASYGLANLNFSTDILRLLPDIPPIKAVRQYTDIFSSLDRFSITLVHENRDNTILSRAGDYLVSLLKKNKYFRGANARFDMLEALAIKKFYQKHYPNLLEPNDYKAVSKKLQPNQIVHSIEKIYDNQIGLGFSSGNIRRDPLQLSSIFWARLKNSRWGFGGKIEQGYLFSTDNKALLVNIPAIASKLTDKEASACWQFLAGVKKTLRQKFPEVRMICIGGKKVALENAAAIRRDIKLVSSIAILALITIMLLAIKNFRILPLVFLPLGIGIAVALGISSCLFPKISLTTLGAGAILLGISIDYVIHHIIHVELHPSLSPAEIMAMLLKPMSFAVLSTAGALILLLFSPFPAHIELGVFVSIGIVTAFLFVAGFFSRNLRLGLSPSKTSATAIVEFPQYSRQIGSVPSRKKFQRGNCFAHPMPDCFFALSSATDKIPVEYGAT